MCHVVIQNSEFRYLNVIVEALEDFYRHDYALLSTGRRTHEQTVSFRLGMYLARRLEPRNNCLFVDCEYHGDMYNPELRKIVNGRNIRPDIIYHDRGRQNEFCVEMKIRSLSDNDYEKLNGLISAYGYREGYGICNINQKFVTVYAISRNYLGQGIQYRFRFDPNACRLIWPENRRQSK